MFVVHYWAKCPIVGDYYTHMKFDTLVAAKSFAKQHNSKVEGV
jgi:hypothetical protein